MPLRCNVNTMRTDVQVYFPERQAAGTVQSARVMEQTATCNVARDLPSEARSLGVAFG